jgi:hypothetical protein
MTEVTTDDALSGSLTSERATALTVLWLPQRIRVSD